MLSFCTSSIAWYQKVKNYGGKKKNKNYCEGVSQHSKTLHCMRSNVKALKFSRLMFKKKKSCFLMSWVGRELIIVMLAQTHTQTHTYTYTYMNLRSSCHLYAIKGDILILGTVRSITNVKQANVKMLLSALALCVDFFSISGMLLFDKQVEPHITCPIMFLDFLCHSLKSPDLIYECTHIFFF